MACEGCERRRELVRAALDAVRAGETPAWVESILLMMHGLRPISSDDKPQGQGRSE